MTDKKKQLVSAQVVLKAPGGQDVRSAASITAENVQHFLPSEENLKKALDYFKKLGFEIQAAYGNSFSITGSPAQFEKVFKTKLSKTEKGGVSFAAEDSEQSLELPTGKLPDEVEKIVAAVTFSEPPDFGPTSF